MSIYDVKRMADHVESYGRLGDTELVHLNPIEVEGLAALSPTGQLTINPVTGKKEAFLPLLIPLLASWGGGAVAGAMGAGAIGSAVAAGAASGVATGAITGDWERGLASGIMGAGIGGALGAAGSAAGEAASQVGTDVAANAVTDMSGALGTAGTPEGIAALSQGATQPEIAKILAQQQGLAQGGVEGTMAHSLGNAGTAESIAANQVPVGGFGTGFDPSKLSSEGFKQGLKQPFQEGSGLGGKLMSPTTMMPVMIGASENMRIDAEEKGEDLAAEQEAEDERQRAASYDRLQNAYRMAQPDAQTGLSPYRSRMSIPPPWKPKGYAEGGVLGLEPMGYQPVLGDFGKGDRAQGRYDAAVAKLAAGDPLVQTDFGNGKRGEERWNTYQAESGASNAYGGIDPVTVQQNLRGQHSVGPPSGSGYRPGFDPEFMYFQDDPDNIQVPELTSQEQWNNMYRPFERISPQVSPTSTEPPSKVPASTTQPVPDTGMMRGGEVHLNVGGRIARLAAGGVADMTNRVAVPQADSPSPPQAQPAAGGQPSDQDIQQLAMALTGQAGDDSDKIVEAFVNKFGPEMFAEAREFILQQLQPNSQTSGMVQGQGGGMDDQVEGTIGGQQPVAVSPGEYIVPADVVSGLGDGSSDAGADILDEMQTKVRKARGGSTQPPPIDPSKVMPV
jgi:hypothetical protein